MTTHEQQARSTLAQLVAHVFAHQNGPIKGLTYEELATRIVRVNKHVVGHAHGMGQVGPHALGASRLNSDFISSHFAPNISGFIPEKMKSGFDVEQRRTPPHPR